ncbi:hypothetical protein D9757_011566 [Collybiopsis confluens]|uniref:FAD-binding domain-containing protein n=1 Tax=Collybiopsis confluens TaxID=2823264 RepID=A0A8H5GNN2_9AGAR|nr:hypothetical protein D9757_011566 [Collybiopsis confluens]
MFIPYMKLEIGARVVSVDPFRPSVTLSSNKVIEADLLIGADGTYSIVRDIICPNSMPQATGDGAYRAIIPVKMLKDDPELNSLVDPPQCHCWIGPSCHIVSYCISGGNDYNIVMVVPEDESFLSWTAEGDPERVKAHFAKWESRVQKLLGLITSVLQTRITVSPPLPIWIHQGNRVALVGDACHSLLIAADVSVQPYRAQAAAMAIEDAAVLGNLFSRLQSKSQIPWLLEGYQAIRKPRTTSTMADSWLNRKIFHLPDGPEQISRDAQWKNRMGRSQQEGTDHTNQWGDKLLSVEQFSYDAEHEVNIWWNRKAALTDIQNHLTKHNLAKL